MVSPNNDDDLMSQVFASVQLPEVKWTSESHETHEVIRKTVTVNENGEQHVHTEHYSYSNQNGGHHESESDEDEHHHHHHDQQQHQHVEQHSDNHGYHHHGGNADEDLVSQVFFNRPTVETFRVENGIPDSESASHRSSSRMSHHSHHSHHSNHSRHMSESDRESNHGGHQILVREQELENGHLAKKVLETVPYKSQQQDSIIAELKKQQSGLTDDSSDDETLKGDNDDDHHAHEEMWHHEPHEEEHIVHYDLPPQEPPRDYGSQRNSVHSEHNAQHHQQTEQANYFNHTSYAHDDNRSNRSNSVHSEANRQHAPPSHHSSHDSIPPYQPPPPPQEPATRDSRASSTSTLRSDRDIHIRTNHTPPAAPQQPIYDHTYGIDENLKNDPKGIHTVREYGTRGHRRSNASELSSVDYNRESFTVGDIEYIQEKPKPRDRTATKQSSMSYNHSHHGHHEHHDNRFRADTKQSGISQHHHQEIHTTKHFAPVKRESYTPRGFGGGQFVANVDDSPIAPVSHLANQYGGRSHGNKSLFFPHKHEEEIEKVHHHDHHSRASSKRGSDVSSVHSLKHIGNKNERSNTQHTISSQTSHGKIAHKRRDSTDSVGTQHTAVVDKHPGKYDSIRVVKNVRSYKEFLDVWSQREIEEATEEGPIHAEPIPRPRYSISARHVYPDFNSLKLVKESKQRPSIRPSETLHEHSGKVDKATSYHDLHLIGGGNKSRHSTFIGEDKSRRSTFVGEHQRSRHSTFVPIHEEEDEESLHHHHHHGHLNGTESLNRSRKSTLKDSEEHKHHEHENHNHEDEDYEINMHELRSVFETDNHRVKSRRASVMSTASGKSVGPIPIVPASHRQPLNHGLLYSSRRRHNRHH